MDDYSLIHEMKITAVIPAYNEEESITEVVKSTLKYVDEVVVIDNGGTDKTSERATEAGARAALTRWERSCSSYVASWLSPDCLLEDGGRCL
jgi:cellulose synthase/poly-beta-1,6-N-acetylglucosamine synthase-like glycosyltransferase